MIEIYGNQTCPFCLRAKRLAETYSLKYEWLDTDMPENLSTMKERQPSATTIPQIWWYGRYVGGYDDFASEIQNTAGGFGEGKL
jgi:glutaredoxin 3